MAQENNTKKFIIEVEAVPKWDEELKEDTEEINIIKMWNFEEEKRGEEISYYKSEKKRLNNSRTRLHHDSCCCWRLVRGRLRCHEKYCK